jgi:hypothetical protein
MSVAVDAKINMSLGMGYTYRIGHERISLGNTLQFLDEIIKLNKKEPVKRKGKGKIATTSITSGKK